LGVILDDERNNMEEEDLEENLMVEGWRPPWRGRDVNKP
jgi:hypothetical protein